MIDRRHARHRVVALATGIALVTLMVPATAATVLAGATTAASASVPNEIDTVAGNGTPGYSGDGGSATSAEVNYTPGVAVDPYGDIVFSDYFNARVRVVAGSAYNPGFPLAGCGGTCTWTAGQIYTVAGTGASAYNGDGISAVTAGVGPAGVAVDPAGNILIGDYNNRVRLVAVSQINPGYPLSGCSGICTWTSGDIYTVAGTGSPSYNGDDVVASSANVVPTGVALDSQDNVILTDRTNSLVRLVAVSASNPGYPLACACTWTEGNVYTIAGTGSLGYNSDGIAAGSSQVANPGGLVVDGQDNVVFADTDNHRVRVVATSVSNPGYTLGGCTGTCTWTAGDVYTIAGTGTPGYSSDGIASDTATLSSPVGVALDAPGNVLVGDAGNNRVRVIATSGYNPGYAIAACTGGCLWTQGDLYTIAGTGTAGYNGDGIAATTATVASPYGVAVDPNGDVVFDDLSNYRVRKIGADAVAPGWTAPATAGDPNGYDTGYLVANSVTINASDVWFDGTTTTGPGGTGGPAAGAGYLEPTAPAESLVGRIGTSGAWTAIATHGTLNGNGRLYLAMNDLTGQYGDNTGSVTVSIAAELSLTTQFGGDGPVLAGTDVDWTGGVENHGHAALTNNDILVSLGTPTSPSLTWQLMGPNSSPVGSVHECAVLGTGLYDCSIASVPAGDTVDLEATIPTKGIAPQTFQDLLLVLSDQTGGFFASTGATAPQSGQQVDGLEYHGTGPTTVAAGTVATISGYIANTSASSSITGISTYSTIDKGHITSALYCSYTNLTPTGATDRCPATGTFDLPPLGDTSAFIASTDIDTTGLAGKTIHLKSWATSPDLGGNAQVLTATIDVIAAAGGITINAPLNNATIGTTGSYPFTAVPSPSAGNGVSSVEFLDGATTIDDVTSPPYTTTLSGLSVGTHTLTAVMHQDSGGPDGSASVSVKVVAAPTTSIVALGGFASGGSLDTAKTFLAPTTVFTPATLKSVAWDVDGATVASLPTTPNAVAIDPAKLTLGTGPHTLHVTVTDSAQQTATASFDFVVPGTTLSVPTATTIAPSVSPGGPAAWTVRVDNPGSAIAHHVHLTLNAEAGSPSVAVPFDTAAMNGALHVPPSTPTCTVASPTTLDCTLVDIPASSAVDFPVFVDTHGVADGATITGGVVAVAANAPATSSTALDPVGVASCGTGPACVKGVVAAGTTFVSDETHTATTEQSVLLSKALTSVGHGYPFGKAYPIGKRARRLHRLRWQPRNPDLNPSIQIQLDTIQATNITDPTLTASLCPTPTTCEGGVSAVLGDFSAYANKTDPIVAVIVQRWGPTVPPCPLEPGGVCRVWVQKPAPTGGSLPAAFALAACVQNATSRQFNTPCVLPEQTKTTIINGQTNKTTYDTVLFVNDDPHFARR